jgi:hypothetical protein
MYLEMGMRHITDVTAYDHIIFVLALCGIYKLNDWKKVLILVSAFTIGHSITLALATLNVISFSRNFVEILISITIIITALFNISSFETSQSKNGKLKYGLALVFGLIHGMGFSNYLKMMLDKGDSIFQPLLAFNIGVEIGQIGIVLIILMLSYLMINILRVGEKAWTIFISGAAFGIALMLLVELLLELSYQ